MLKRIKKGPKSAKNSVAFFLSFPYLRLNYFRTKLYPAVGLVGPGFSPPANFYTISKILLGFNCISWMHSPLMNRLLYDCTPRKNKATYTDSVRPHTNSSGCGASLIALTISQFSKVLSQGPDLIVLSPLVKSGRKRLPSLIHIYRYPFQAMLL